MICPKKEGQLKHSFSSEVCT